ncbi:MAG: hypothetical protein PVI74_01730 [Syntrophobacterales bacterium]|jgi:hypothetical protein
MVKGYYLTKKPLTAYRLLFTVHDFNDFNDFNDLNALLLPFLAFLASLH